jgi:hypothetical protein
MKKRKNTRQIEVYKKYIAPEFKQMKVDPMMTAVVIMNSERTHRYKSRVNSSSFVVGRTSIMDPINLSKESPEIQKAIIEKSKRIAPAFNKGALQYVTDESEPKYLGRKL